MMTLELNTDQTVKIPATAKVKFTRVVNLEGITVEQVARAIAMQAARNYYNNNRPNNATPTGLKTYEEDLVKWNALEGTEVSLDAKDYIQIPGTGKSPKAKKLSEMTAPELNLEYLKAKKDMNVMLMTSIRNLMKANKERDDKITESIMNEITAGLIMQTIDDLTELPPDEA